jgi:Pro-kumamolisin, activation domain/Bacterial Ig-like domain (group 3)
MIAKGSCVHNHLLLISFLVLASSSCAFGQTSARVVGPVDNTKRITLSGNVHPLARAEFDRGPVDSTLAMTRVLLLLKRGDDQDAALQGYMQQQHDKSSTNYHVWLTPDQFGTHYGPADADIHTVMEWLSSQGLTVTKVYSGKTIIEFSGSAAQVQSTFGVGLHKYEVNGKTYVANSNDPQIPAGLAPVLVGVVSLNNFPRQSHLLTSGQVRKTAGKGGLEPLFTFPNPSGNGGNFYGLAPGDFATIYNSKGLIASGNDGTGQTIAIVGETNINVTDVQAFRQMFGLPANFSATNVILNGEDPGITSTNEESEADLDVQWSGAVAPGATIDYVVSGSTPASQGIDLSALYIIEYNLAGIISESYGSCESALGTTGNAFYNSLWEQAAAQGVTVILSAGDGGSAGCDDFKTATVATHGLAVSGAASTPFNVAVGGTDFDQVNKWSTYWSATNTATGTDVIGTSALSYIPEIPWSNNCAQIGLTGCGSNAPQGSLNIVAGSGGASNTYGKPEWQIGISGMPNDSHRDLPDISLFASSGFDGSGYIICQADANGGTPCNLTAGEVNFTVVGGTSASSPAFAGVMALVNQYESAHGGTSRQGNANYVLYSLAKKSGASCASSATEPAGCIFNDVTKGNSVLPTGTAGVGTNSVPCQGATANCSAAIASQNGVLIEPTSATTEAWTATAGYDLTTGLGSVNVNNLATNWRTVSTVATTTSLTLSPTTGITHGPGENVTVNVTVTPTSGTATGEVSLIARLQGPSGATSQGLDVFTLDANGKIVNAATNSLPGGTNYQVYAHYAGDGTNAPSDSTPVTLSVGAELSKTFIVIPTFDSSGNQTAGNTNSVSFGSAYIIQMVVANSAATANTNGLPNGICAGVNRLTCPTGKVTVTDNGTPLGNGAGGPGIYSLDVGDGYTSDLTPQVTGGTHTLTATYGGDKSYASSSTSASLTVLRASSSIGQSLNVIKAVAGVPFSDEITGYVQTNSGTIAPTGTVTFFDGPTQLGSPVNISGYPGGSAPSFFAQGILTVGTAGANTLIANYSGDTNYAPSTSSTTVFVLYPTTAIVTSNPSTINYGATVTLTGIVNTTVPASNAALKPTGSVLVGGGLDGATVTSVVATADSSGNWELQVTATATPRGTEAYALTYVGDNNFAGSSATTANVTVNIPDFSITPVNGLSVVPIAGQSASGQITITPLSQTPSIVNLTLSYSGSAALPGYTITLSPQQVSLNGSPVMATLSLTPSNAAPSNALRRKPIRHSGFFAVERHDWWLLSLFAAVSVMFVVGLPGRRRRARAALGLGFISVLCLALGCGGGGSTSGGSGTGSGGGTTGGQPQQTSITLTTSLAKLPASSISPTITATVTASKPLTGTVNFYNFGTLVAPDVPLGGNQASLAHASMFGNVGLYQITATYNGDPNNLSSTSVPLTEVVTGTFEVNIDANTGEDLHIAQAFIGLQ